jgi:apolipoprotein N-acyltransferase
MLRKVGSWFVVRGSWFVKNTVLPVLSGVFLALAFSYSAFSLFAWFGFLPLFFALQNQSRFKAFLFSYLTGLVFWLGTVYWLVNVTFPGTLLLCAYLAFYFGLFGFFFPTIHDPRSTHHPLLLSSLWVILEYIRSHLFTGFPWALLSYSQSLNLPLIQIADLGGGWLVSFLIIFFNLAVFGALTGRKRIILPAVLLFSAAIFYGNWRLAEFSKEEDCGKSLPVSVVQGNIPQALKWNSAANDYICGEYHELTLEALKSGQAKLIVWPEAALPVILEDEPEYFRRVQELAKSIQTPLLLGAVTRREDYYNSAVLVSRDGQEIARYDKLHLVPFGEYIPLRGGLFKFLEGIIPIGDIRRGSAYTLFPLSGEEGKFAVLICFEDIFPEIAREFTLRGADFLVNITNDGWYGRTSASYQHLQASVLRAVENRRPVVRAANTGISGFIASSGKILALLSGHRGENIFLRGYLTAGVPLCFKELTLYGRIGDGFIALCALFVIITILGKLLQSLRAPKGRSNLKKRLLRSDKI